MDDTSNTASIDHDDEIPVLEAEPSTSMDVSVVEAQILLCHFLTCNLQQIEDVYNTKQFGGIVGDKVLMPKSVGTIHNPTHRLNGSRAAVCCGLCGVIMPYNQLISQHLPSIHSVS